MAITPIIAGAAKLAGGLLSGSAAQDAYNTAANQYNTSANLANFTPVGITSRFGRSGYTYGPSGQLTGVGYEVAPDIAAMREEAIRQAGGSLGYAGQAQGAVAPAQAAAQSMFGLGQQYLGQSPQDVAQQWMTSQQALLQPSREQAYAQMQQQLQNTGRAGLSVAQGGSLGAANPEAQAYYNALAQQDAKLAASAQEQGRESARFGAGLVGSGLNTISGAYGAQEAAYQPYTSAMGAASGLEAFGQAPLATSLQYGQAAAGAGANVAVLQSRGTATQQASSSYSPWGTALSGLGGLLGSWV